MLKVTLIGLLAVRPYFTSSPNFFPFTVLPADRLWIQRALPKPNPLKNRKRKRVATDTNDRKAKRSANGSSKNSKHITDDCDEQPITPKSTSSRSRQRAVQSVTAASGGRGGGRVAKTQAKIKLDAQAKELAEFQRQISTASKNKGKGPALPPPPPKGTRLSKRLRGSMEEDEWQPVPEEWLTGAKEPGSETNLPKTGLESDDESALTSLSDEDEDETVGEAGSEAALRKLKGGGEIGESVNSKELESEVPADFIEWDTVSRGFLATCVLYANPEQDCGNLV